MGSRAERSSENARHVFNTAENSEGSTFCVHSTYTGDVMVFQLHFRIRLFDRGKKSCYNFMRMQLEMELNGTYFV